MISENYEKTLFDSPVSDGIAIAHRDPNDPRQGSIRVLNEEFLLLRQVRHAAQVVRQVAQSKDVLFAVAYHRHDGGVPTVAARRLGKLLMSLTRTTRQTLDHHFPHHGFNPYVELLLEVQDQAEGIAGLEEAWAKRHGSQAIALVGQLNAFVTALRARAGGRSFRMLLERFRRRRDKNTRSVRRYIDAIFTNRGSRHLVIRLDLGYAMEGAWTAARPTSVTLQQAKGDLAKFQRYLRENLPTTGFIATLEYGLLRGYHFHTLIFLNGHLVQDEVRIPWRLGEHWMYGICEGQGRYWNCNAQEYAERGIGMINYYDGDKRVALVEKVAGYLTKTDFWVQFQPGGKTLFKGLMPGPSPKRGRPREYEERVS